MHDVCHNNIDHACMHLCRDQLYINVHIKDIDQGKDLAKNMSHGGVMQKRKTTMGIEKYSNW
jgi:hypothetical protein